MSRYHLPWLAAIVFMTTAASLAADERPTDQWLTRPVDDATFRSYLDFFKYDPDVPFELDRAGVEEQQGLRIEKVSFQSTPGVRVEAKVLRLTKSTDRAALVMLHGGTPGGKDSASTMQLATLLGRANERPGATTEWRLSISGTGQWDPG